jgi:uncharacterized membrane protein YccC
VFAALFTIHLSADSSLSGALGRISGALLGIGFGLAANWALGPVILGLALAAALANAAAVLRPSLRYASVTPAIVALQPRPEFGDSLTTATAVVIGTATGVMASLALWPLFGRQRASLRSTIDPCVELLKSIGAGSDRRPSSR